MNRKLLSTKKARNHITRDKKNLSNQESIFLSGRTIAVLKRAFRWDCKNHFEFQTIWCYSKGIYLWEL